MRETRVTGLLVQNLSNVPMRGLRLAAIGFAVGLGIGLVMTAGAARAGGDEEDTRSFTQKIVDGFKSSVTGTNMESAGIDYRERSPLVVPPKIDLPPPAAASNDVNAVNWPKDPDEKRRKAALAARKKSVTASSHELTPAEAEAARASAEASQQPLPQQSFGEKITNYFGGTKPEVGQFKGEPTRETLTQPPPGYQVPSPNYAYGVGLKASRNKDSKATDNKDANNQDPKDQDPKNKESSSKQ